MIEAFRLANFKSYADAKLPLGPLTMLVGANASGKSNLLEALELLAWLARGRRLADLAGAMRDSEIALRGRLADLRPVADRPLLLGCTVEREPLSTLYLTIEIMSDERGPRIVGEELQSSYSESSVPYYYKVDHAADQHGAELGVAYNNFTKGRNKPHIACVDQQAVFTQLLTPARFTHIEAQRQIPRAALDLKTALASILFLDPNPKAARGWSYADDRELRGNGENLSTVLFQLCESGAKDHVLSFVRSLPEQDIADIDFLRTARNEVMVRLLETFGREKAWRDATVLSDGTLRVLGVAAAILSVEEGSLVVIEEIDNGVHPSRARTLLEAIHAIAKDRGLRVLLTTHNPALADAIPRTAIGDVVACYRDPTSGCSRLQRLGELEDYAALVAQGPLGFLLTSGTLDKYLKHHRDEQARARQGREMLTLFRRVK